MALVAGVQLVALAKLEGVPETLVVVEEEAEQERPHHEDRGRKGP